MNYILLLLAAYASGCVNPAYYLVKFFYKKDLRILGSGTLGTKNVFRTIGFYPALAVFLIDFMKPLPVLYIFHHLGSNSSLIQALIVFSVLLGHIFPAQLNFKGGKGAVVFASSSAYILSFNLLFPPLFLLNIIFVIIAHRIEFKRSKYVVKIADNNDEFEQIFYLNYQTFVKEIPQHEENDIMKLKDKFHEKNTYFICKDSEQVIGMVAFCDKRPFSLDSKVENIDKLLPKFNKICEIRLLAIKKEYRKTAALTLMLKKLIDYIQKHKMDIAIISATTRELRMYNKIGFKPFGDLVGTEGAMYQPMYITKNNLVRAKWLL